MNKEILEKSFEHWGKFIDEQTPLTTPLVEYQRAFEIGYSAAQREDVEPIRALSGFTPRDWIEDLADDDNGQYQKTCDKCGLEFQCHKHRLPTCKLCWIKFATSVVIEHNVSKREAERGAGWIPVTCEDDLEQPPGLYWTAFVDGEGCHIGSDRIFDIILYENADKFAANTVAYIRIAEPQPYKAALSATHEDSE